MSIKKITEEILKICKSDEFPYKENKQTLTKLFQKLKRSKVENEEDVKILIVTHKELSAIKNRKASYLEEKIARSILVDLPTNIEMDDEDVPEDTIETLTENYESDQRPALKMSAELLKYGKELLASKKDKSKRYKNRIKEALRLLNELQQIYDIAGLKELFQANIQDKDKEVQFFALYGLEIYYAHKNADELTKEEENILEEIIQATKARETASTCCQILINADKMDELGAVISMDDWKERNWK